MAKISLNIPDSLEKQIREYSEKNNINLTNTCINLFQKGLDVEENKINLSDYKALKEKYAKLQIDFENERNERLKVLDDYKNFNTTLLELMKADRILQIEQKQQKRSLGQRIKIFFMGESEHNSKK